MRGTCGIDPTVHKLLSSWSTFPKVQIGSHFKSATLSLTEYVVRSCQASSSSAQLFPLITRTHTYSYQYNYFKYLHIFMLYSKNSTEKTSSIQLRTPTLASASASASLLVGPGRRWRSPASVSLCCEVQPAGRFVVGGIHWTRALCQRLLRVRSLIYFWCFFFVLFRYSRC